MTKDDLISRQAAIDAIANCTNCGDEKTLRAYVAKHNLDNEWSGGVLEAINAVEDLSSAQPDTEKICARIKAEAIKRNVEYMKHGDRYMLGFVDGMRLARRIVDGTVDDPVYFTTSGE